MYGNREYAYCVTFHDGCFKWKGTGREACILPVMNLSNTPNLQDFINILALLSEKATFLGAEEVTPLDHTYLCVVLCEFVRCRERNFLQARIAGRN